MIATRTWRTGIFTPPSLSPGESQWTRFREEAEFYWDLSGLRLAWAQRLKELNPTLKPLVKEIAHRQNAGSLRQFVDRWQNPATGCWGQWMIDRQGRVWKMDDMGITFHVVSDLHGQVGQLDRIAKRLLQLDRVNFPAGIRFDGHYENHLNWDAVKTFRIAWPFMDDATKQKARNEISKMLQWCLTQSLQPDGSFKVSDLDDTPGDAYRYGVWFLQETGYFQPSDRFWTNQDFPESKAIRARIATKLSSIGLRDPGLRRPALLEGKRQAEPLER